MRATVKKVMVETPRVLTLVLEPEHGVSFKTGQAMKWNIPGIAASRLYSLASPGGENRKELWFTMRIVEDGRFSPHLRKLKEGDAVELQGPFGKFIFDDKDPRDIGLIAGGSGISVLRAILCHVLDNRLPHKVHLVFSVLNVREIIYKDELQELAKRHPNFTYTIVVTEKDPLWRGHCGYVTKEIFDKEFGDYKERFYICGPQPFIDCAEGLLKEAGVPEERILIDRWTFYTPKQKGEHNESMEI